MSDSLTFSTVQFEHKEIYFPVPGHTHKEAFPRAILSIAEEAPVTGAALSTDRVKVNNLNRELESLKIQAAEIAHEFSNLFTEMLGNIEFVKHFQTERRPREALEILAQRIESAIALNRQLNRVANGITTGGENTSLSELIFQAARIGLSGTGIVGRYKLAANLPPLEMERIQVSQVITKLVQTAAQAMPGTGVIEVEAEVVEVTEGSRQGVAAGQYLEVRVQDKEAAIPSGYLKGLFEPNFSTDATQQGLELSNCYRNVKGYGGDINVESEEGVGTIIRVMLPVSQEKSE